MLDDSEAVGGPEEKIDLEGVLKSVGREVVSPTGEDMIDR